VSGFGFAKLGYRTAMDHVEHVFIVRTSMPIRIAWRTHGEVKAFTAPFQVNKHVAAACKTVGSSPQQSWYSDEPSTAPELANMRSLRS